MTGAILGDIVGSPYEFDSGEKIKDFGPLFIKESNYTDDSVMTVAVADGFMKALKEPERSQGRRQKLPTIIRKV